MISMANLFKLSRHKHVEEEVLKELFAYERSTLITTILLETILLYILTPLIGNIIIAWYGVILSLSLWRFYNAYDYHKNPGRNIPLIWHEKFVVQVWATALLFSLLALFAIPQLDAYYQLFTFIVLIGISSGAIKALSSDHRTAIGYLVIILFPLIVEMLLLGRQETLILAFLVAIYFFVQISVLLRAYALSEATRKVQAKFRKAQAILQEKQGIIQRFFDQTDEAIFLYDRHLNLIDCNRAFEEMFLISADEAKQYTIDTFPNAQWIAIVRKALESDDHVHIDSYRSPAQETLWLEAKCIAMEGALGGAVGGMGLIKDRSAEHLTQQELTRIATNDWMTGVSNRLGFQQYMQALLQDPRHRTHASLFFYMDVNRFKQINDLYGHEMGDHVIKAVASRFKQITPPEAILTRLGGDEFSLVIPHVSSRKEGMHGQMAEWSAKIQACFDRPYRIEEREFDLRCSVGAVYVDPGEQDIDKIVSRADLAMFQAKRQDSGAVVLYTPSLEGGQCQAYEVHHMLGEAIEQEQLKIFYQPIVESRTGRVVAAEALVRWQHPEKGLLSPTEFLPIAVLSGQVTQVDRWVLHAVLEQIARWKEAGTFPLDHVSINVDVQSLNEEDFVFDLYEKMEEQGVKGEEIRLELSEFSLAENVDKVADTMLELNRHGLLCIVDDYGTGCLSLFHLKDMPLEAIKIDRVFVQRLTEKIENVLLIQTIIDMAQKFRYEIIVKGVEDAEQRDVIAGLNRDICFQGALESEPLPGDVFHRRFLASS